MMMNPLKQFDKFAGAFNSKQRNDLKPGTADVIGLECACPVRAQKQKLSSAK